MKLLKALLRSKRLRLLQALARFATALGVVLGLLALQSGPVLQHRGNLLGLHVIGQALA
jgi:hypothetical protein